MMKDAPLVQMDWQEVGVLKRLLPELACPSCQVKLENCGTGDDYEDSDVGHLDDDIYLGGAIYHDVDHACSCMIHVMIMNMVMVVIE